MNNVSLFYIDEKEINMLYEQNHVSIEKKVTKKDEGSLNANLRIGTSGIVRKMFSSEIQGSGTVNNSILEEVEIKSGLGNKISEIINEYKIEELTNELEDGKIVCFSEYFTLFRIDTEDCSYEEYDHIENLEYILYRLRDAKSIFTFEMNKFHLRMVGYENKNPKIDFILMKMQSSKLYKEIHHYSRKVKEYVPFLFNIIGEINIIKNGYIIKPYIVWR